MSDTRLKELNEARARLGMEPTDWFCGDCGADDGDGSCCVCPPDENKFPELKTHYGLESSVKMKIMAIGLVGAFLLSTAMMFALALIN
jgi:hypothetical protein